LKGATQQRDVLLARKVRTTVASPSAAQGPVGKAGQWAWRKPRGSANNFGVAEDCLNLHPVILNNSAGGGRGYLRELPGPGEWVRGGRTAGLLQSQQGT